MTHFISISSNAMEIAKQLEYLPKRGQEGALKGLQRSLILTEERVRMNTQVKMRRGGAGLSGRLTSYAVMRSGLGLDGAIGFRKTKHFPYELSQEFGAKAKGGPMAIPISGEAKAQSNRGLGPRSFGDRLTLIKSRSKALLIERSQRYTPTQGAYFTGKTHYVLVKSIPARLRFRENVAASVDKISDGIVSGFRGGMRRG